MLQCDFTFHFIQNNFHRFEFNEKQQEQTDILFDYHRFDRTLFVEIIRKNGCTKTATEIFIKNSKKNYRQKVASKIIDSIVALDMANP